MMPWQTPPNVVACVFHRGRQIRKNGKNFELRETRSPDNAVFDVEKNDIDGENLWFWNV
jgi:hypothetical protein